MTGTHRMEVELPGRTIVWEAELRFRSDLEAYHYELRPTCIRERKMLREKAWKERFARDP